MYDFPIALQLYSVRHELQADFEGTLQKVKEMGYDGVEFAGLYGFDPKDVKALVEKYALQPISAHIPFSEMLKDPDVLKIYKEIGCEFAVIPGLSQEYRPGEPKFPDLIEAARMLTKKAQEIGMKFCYHNHDFEFVKLGDEYAIDYFYREVP
ncbi:MAG: sugar phosphate isomerase/epimerase, partial [Lachnospiraceae bacterium]|nr:sugar phosphate isomerase/epimerase [Lachnospiraceae bacterium]